MTRCRSCFEVLPDGARFCPSCGAPQQDGPDAVSDAAEAVADDTRRVVTVLFADLVGFTSLSEHLDPERVKRFVDDLFERLVADVESFGGRVDKVLGDGLVALFGAPIAHEDDADRAVRAGLAMQRTIRRFGDEHPSDDVRMRVGINTGEVLVGTLAGTDYTAMGDVVNTAARLQELARPGAVLVGQATRDLCSPAIRFVRIDPVQLRGREQETCAYRAVAVEPGAAARRWPSDVELVGRVAETGILEAALASVRSGRCVVAAVSGEAGIGKSRLVGEAVSRFVDANPATLVLEGACAPYGESNVWWPVTGGLMARLGLDRSAPAEESRRLVTRRLTKLGDFVPGTPEFDRTVELALHLLGKPSQLDSLGPGRLRDSVVAGIMAALRRRSERGPVIVWVDDLQWGAPVLRELLEAVARQLSNVPVMIVTTARSDDHEVVSWPPPVDPALAIHLALEALDDAESAALVRRAAGRELPENVVDTITRRSGGNPLFLIELARLAAATEGNVEPGRLPGSMRALIAARLDQLAPTQRQVLDNAAIIGNTGDVASLEEFAAELGQWFDPDALAAIEATGMMTCTEGTWYFRSDVVREVAYHTLTKQARAQRHAGVARYLEHFEPGLIDRRAHHTAAAAELVGELGSVPGVPADIDDHAVRLLARAAKSWVEQGAYRRAVQLIDRALCIGVPDPALHGDLLLRRAEALVDLRDMRPARARANELVAYAHEAGDRVLRAEAMRLLGTIEQSDGDLVAARIHLRQAVDEFRDIGDPSLLAEALRARGFGEVFGGSLTEADRFLHEAESLFAGNGDARGVAWVQQHRAWVSFLAGDHSESEARLQTAIDTFHAMNDRAGISWSMGLLGYIYHFTRRDDEALVMAAEVLDEAKRWGDDWGVAMMHNLQAGVHLWRGELDDALADAERALGVFRRIDDRFGIIQALGTLSRTYVALGRFADANRSVEEVMVLSASFGELAYPLIAAAGTAMHLGDGRRAVELAEEAVGRLDTTGANLDEARVMSAFGELLDGDADKTLARLIDVETDRSPFGLAARATAFAVIGDHERALADADAVEAMPAISYWDRAIARVAAAASAVGAEGAQRRAALAELLDDIDDVVVTSYAMAVLHRLAGDDAEPAPHSAVGGWAGLADRLVAATAG